MFICSLIHMHMDSPVMCQKWGHKDGVGQFLAHEASVRSVHVCECVCVHAHVRADEETVMAVLWGEDHG